MTLFYNGTENGKHENGIGILIYDSVLPHLKTFEATMLRKPTPYFRL